MSKKTRSARGEQVDFDLLKVKEQIATSPPPQDVKARQDFIERRMRRRLKKVPAPAPKVAAEEAADPKMPGTEELSEQPAVIDEAPKAPVKKTRQKARPPKKTDTNTDTGETDGDDKAAT